MLRRDDERGLSTIVATLIIILLVLVSAGIIWVVVRNVIQGNAEQINLGKLTLDLAIEKVQLLGNNLSLTVKRNQGQGEFVGISFVVEDGENSEVFTEYISMGELQVRTFTFILNQTNPNEITKIKVVPIFRLESGKEVAGDVKDTWNVNSPTSVSQCTPSCPSGAECGSNGCPGGTCGAGCSGGETCSNHICVAPCNLLTATWNTTSVLQGEPVRLEITGTDCDGKTITFEIWEKDGFLNSPDSITDFGGTNPSNIVFTGTNSYTPWNAFYMDDSAAGQSNPPEYYFIARVLGETEFIESSNSGDSDPLLLTVTQPVQCGINDCQPTIGETCSTCPQDCGVCPPVCGNSIIEGTEQCDCGIDGCISSELNGETCTSRLSGYEGTLGCTSGCAFDTSACTLICVPTNCNNLGYDCGTNWPDLCGDTLTCGNYAGGCAPGYVCSSGHCTTSCTTHESFNCTNGDAYWWNSCGQSEGLKEDCNSTSTCVGGNCIPQGSSTWSNELMINGGFEFGNLTGWTEVNGNYGTGFSTGYHMSNGLYVLPQSGSYQAWFNGASSTASGYDFYLYQDVDLTSYASYIDAGIALLNASGWGSTSEMENGVDTTRIQFIFLGNSHNVISTALDSGWVYWVNGTWWQKKVASYSIPTGTRYIRAWASSYENCGSSYCDSGTWDSFSVKVGNLGPCTDTCTSLSHNCGTVCGATCGTGICSSGYYCESGHCTVCTPRQTSNCTNGDAYWWNSCGQPELKDDCNATETCSGGICVNAPPAGTQIIADHTIVDRYDDIPQYYINEVKKMMVFFAGESHSAAYRSGLDLLESQNAIYDSSIGWGFQPYTDQQLRVVGAAPPLFPSYTAGEDVWYTWKAYPAGSEPPSSQTIKNAINTQATASNPINVLGFAWCWDMVATNGPTSGTDPVYGVHWYGASAGGPDGSLEWGLDAADNSVTGNDVNMDTYLTATEDYIAYCAANSPLTHVVFTTGPVDSYTGEQGYQVYLKHQYIRNYVQANSKVLFDYADILSYDDDGSQTTTTWNGHTYPIITQTNLGDGSTGHIGDAGAIRLAKAQWWMLARLAGWDGVSS